MSMDFRRRLPIPMEIKQELPLSDALAVKKAERDWEIAQVLKGESSRKLLIVGPCSADREDAVLEYCVRLAGLQEKVREKLVVVPRIHTNRASKMGDGYKGMLHQPDPSRPTDMLAGIKAVRRLNLRVIEETGLFSADEMLYPETNRFLSDLLVYNIIGTRSVEDQEHRLVASGLKTAVGVATPTSGDMGIMLGSINTAQHPHTFLYRNWECVSTGNPLAHALLQGYVDAGGRKHPNYTYDSLQTLCGLYEELNLKNPAAIVDCSHNNSREDFKEQPRIAASVLDSCVESSDIAKLVKGFMVESYLEEGCQPIGGGVYGRSITDPCLGWADTERLVLDIAERL